ncbi:baseplate wedge subunit [Morganella phage vB_MmoM_MP1]|uniref:Baseplate wedge tail fiber connector n=1 Tax=Morganella phage vB_MmoM_MP1 TaxID=1852628 RepID=A0A192YA95_9CAUD|nr:baseplate wedge subunit [Morganella phage vB_MmoM_MP1]ANM46433.1 baseplate wedge tail fiber connector [Morganella phage vB_MmoM_MP1]
MTELYRAIITSKFRTKKLLSFYNDIGDEENKSNIYVTFGREEAWANNEKDVGFAPPFPIDDQQGVSDMWTHMIGAMKVDRTLVDAVIPRRDWGDIRYPNPRNFQIGDVVVTNNAPYNQTDIGDGWKVYRVLDVPKAGVCSITSIKDKEECLKLGGQWTASQESILPPRGRGDAEKGGMVDMEDGYLWEYMYTIPPDVSINRCTNEYIVVPTPDELSRDYSRWGYEDNLSWEVNDNNLIYRLKVVTLRFRAYMDSAYFPEASWPGNNGFRQLSVVIDPLEKKRLSTDKDVRAHQNYYRISQLERHSGEMIYMENRPPITRSTDQVEQIDLIFEF